DGIRDRTVTGVQTCALPIFCDPGQGPWHAALDAAHDSTHDASNRPAGHDLALGAVRFPGELPPSGNWRLRRDPLRGPFELQLVRSEERRVGKECSSGGWSCV